MQAKCERVVDQRTPNSASSSPASAPRDPDAHDRPSAGTVLIVTAGGLEDGGGIGRQMGYFLRGLGSDQGGLTYRVVDSRGPWFIGSSPLYAVRSLPYLGRAALEIIRARSSASSPCLAHVNISGRGSTLRKIPLTRIAHARGLPYILHIHDYDYAAYFQAQRPFLKRLIAGMFHRAAQIIVLGQRDKDAITRTLELPDDRVVVLNNAVPDPSSDRPKAPRAEGPCRFVFLGYLSARKGVPELLEALGSEALSQRAWHATLAGGGPVEEFRALADRLGIGDRVDFPGWIDQPEATALCASSDVLVLPSHAEGLAMSVLEGLSHGLPVITTPVGAHLEVIEPEVSGLLIPPGDVAALTAALARVIDDEALRARLAEGARKRFLEKFDVRKYAARLAALHAAALGRPADRPR